MSSTGTEKRLEKLADAVRAAVEALGADRAARDGAIIEAEAAGYSVGQIARATGMGKSHVQRILVGETAAAQEAARALGCE